MRPLAFSASRVKAFTSCAKKFWHMTVLKKGDPDKVEFKQGLAGKRGQDLHEAMEHRLLARKPLPLQYQHMEPVAGVLERAPGFTLCEAPWALDTQLNPCGTKDWDRVYVRAVPDVAKVTDTFGAIVDYKTGRPEFDEYQLKLNAAVMFRQYPSLQRISTAYMYLKIGELSKPAVYFRQQEQQLWGDLLVVPRQIEEARVLNHWPAKPGRQCKWCDVNGAGKCDKAQVPYDPN